MRKLTIEVELGNSAMLSSRDVVQALHGALDAEDDGPLIVGEQGTVVDANGNVVGSWKVTL